MHGCWTHELKRFVASICALLRENNDFIIFISMTLNNFVINACKNTRKEECPTQKDLNDNLFADCVSLYNGDIFYNDSVIIFVLVFQAQF